MVFKLLLKFVPVSKVLAGNSFPVFFQESLLHGGSAEQPFPLPSVPSPGVLLRFMLLPHIFFLGGFQIINLPVELRAPVLKLSFNHFAKHPASCLLLFEFPLCI